jgi:hypothetical protein
MSNDPQAGILTILGGVVADVVTLSRNGSLDRQARRAARAAEQEARLEERRARERRRRWVAAVEQQMSRGDAGDATETQARAALSGRRRNPLDERKFR